jgi:hypothetical protein
MALFTIKDTQGNISENVYIVGANLMLGLKEPSEESATLLSDFLNAHIKAVTPAEA